MKTTFLILTFFCFSTCLLAGDKLSTEELIQNLQDQDPKVRIKAAKELGDRGEKLGVEALVRATGDPDPKVQLEVVRALGKINHPEQVSSLSHAARNSSGEAQKEALRLITEIYIPTKDRNAFQELWKTLQKVFNPPHPRIVEPWIQVDQEAIDSVLFVLDHKDSVNRIEAAATLGILRADPAMPRLIHYLKSPNHKMVQTCIRSIGYIGNPEAGEHLLFLLKHSEKKIIMDATRVLGLFKYNNALPELRPLLNSGDEEIQREALLAISRIGDRSSEPTFQTYMASDDKYLRQYAIEGFGRTQSPGYVQTLQLQYQREKTESIKLALCFSLFSLGETAYIDSLVRFLDNRQYRDQVRGYLVELGPRAVSGLIPYLRPAQKDFKLVIIRTLGDMHQPSAISYLEPYTKDKDLDIAQEATDAIRKLKKIETLASG